MVVIFLKNNVIAILLKNLRKQPIGCLRLHHSIQLERKIRETKSTAEERLSLTKTKPEDCGFILEWSRYHRF
jgi:hypothetical protein